MSPIVTLTKHDLVKLGYGPSFSVSIIRESKQLMVQKGYSFYNTRKLGRVPVDAVEEILGITLNQEILLKLNAISVNEEDKSE